MLDLANRKSSAKNRGVPGVHLELRRRPVHLAARSAENLELDSIFCISVNYLQGDCKRWRLMAFGHLVRRRRFWEFGDYKKTNLFFV